MIWITVVLALTISLAAVAYVVLPLAQKEIDAVILEDDRLTELVSRKDAVLRAIKDLEFDYQVGKVGEDDFRRFDARLRRQAIGYLQQIEKIAPESTRLDEALEAEIARHRRTQAVSPAAEKAETSEAPVATTPAQAGRFCTNCGEPVDPAHKFCAHCGAPVTARPPVAD